MPEKFTVFGSSGFIGRNLVNFLTRKGYDVFTPDRDVEDFGRIHLGNVVYAIGLTGDFRFRPFDTVESHVCKLLRLLKNTQFDSWLYLSSTRIYEGLQLNEPAGEDALICARPGIEGIYNISKLLGESLCLSMPDKRIRVARLSNVFAHNQSRHTFLAAIINELLQHKRLLIKESPDSCKDYVSLADVLHLIEKISLFGRHRIYNLASGRNVKHEEIAKILATKTGFPILFDENANCRKFPLIDTNRIKSEFDFDPESLENEIATFMEKEIIAKGDSYK